MSTTDEKMKLHLVIDGASADELFAVGPNDLREYFLPEKLGVNADDVVSIRFSKVTERTEYGMPSHSIVHKDNYLREESKQP